MNEKELKSKLTEQQYNVLRKKATEQPFTGDLLYNKESGEYLCAACNNPLFSSETKFDSGSGWPSFYDIINNKAVKLETDKSHGMHRTEVLCSRCGSHLGHLFNDALKTPTGKRYCINSLALNFKKKSTKK